MNRRVASVFVLVFATTLLLCIALPVRASPLPADCAAADVQYLVDLTQPQTDFPHFWENCVGSDHGLMALRKDYQTQLALAAQELGFKGVRFHGIFDDDLSTLLAFNNGTATYSFFNANSIYDYILSLGIRPIVELSFMPELIASGNQTVFHYKGNITPPQNYTYWADLVINFVTNLVQRYGLDEIRQWHFEVWNEPNCGFWTGNQTEYFHLLEVTYHAIKSVDSLIQVGGPATCQSQWLNDTIAFTTAAGFQLDFISTHEYPTDVTPTTRNTMQQVLTKAREEVGTMPLFYTEYNDGLYYPPLHDYSFAAAFVIKNIKDVQGLVQVFSFWTFSDIFEEQGFDSTPFQGGFGMMTINGVRKPSWRAFQLLHQAGDLLVSDTLLGFQPNIERAYKNKIFVADANYTTVDVLATVNASNPDTLQILITNHDVPPNVVNNQTVCLIINWNTTQTVSSSTATLQRIDEYNANPYQCWVDMGSPQYLNSTQIDVLNQCSETSNEQVVFTPNSYSTSAVSYVFNIPPEGVAAFTLPVVD